MPLLARAKRQVGSKLHSSAAVKEASQTQLCAYLSIALRRPGRERTRRLVVGRPLAALAIAAVALKEGRESWRGERLCRGLLLTITATSATAEHAGAPAQRTLRANEMPPHAHPRADPSRRGNDGRVSILDRGG